MNNREAHFYLEELQRMMTQHRGIFSEEFVCANGMAIQALEKAQEQRWIPISERLPDDGSEVWVTIKGSDVIKVEAGETIEQAIDRVNRIRWVTRAYWSEEEHGWNDPTFGCPLVVQPIAWMPIEKPEPYEEVQE